MTTKVRVRDTAARGEHHHTPVVAALDRVGGRFIARSRLGGRALYWLAWMIASPRSVVSGGVQREVQALGVGAVRLVASASVLVGLITTFQIASQLAPFTAQVFSARAVGWFGARELGPLSVALLVVSRSASAIAGELASMNANAEVDALRAMGLDPVKYLVAPKLAALVVALPVLTLAADFLIPLGGWVGSVLFLGFSTNFFMEQLRGSFELRDVAVGIGKSVLFAFVIGFVAADEGLSGARRAAAIGEAATRAVVWCMIGVLATDTVVNAIFYFIPRLI